MFNILIDKPPNNIMDVPICTDYRNMILFEQLIADNKVQEDKKIEIALELLYKEKVYNIKKAWEMLLWYYRCGDEIKKDGSGNGKPKRLYDFEQESDLIYASFLDGHHIRLQETNMHWWEFRTLMFTFPSGTQMHDRIMYRSIDLTNITDKKERSRISKIQKLYELKQFDVPAMTREQKDKAYIERMNKRWESAHAEMEKCRIEKLSNH